MVYSTLLGILCTNSQTPCNSLTNHQGFANPTLGNAALGYRGQIYDEHPVVSGLFVEFQLLMFRCSDRILNCLIHSDILHQSVQ